MNQLKKAFTLIEIFFVLGIMAILMAIILPSFKGLRDETDAAKVKTELGILQTALEGYYSEYNKYPDQDYQRILIYEPTLKIINKFYLDPFNSSRTYEYYYSPDQKYYLVRSYGYNRQPDLDFIQDIDPVAGTVTSKNTDDFYITNLKEKE